jgi:hypothetical protein
MNDMSTWIGTEPSWKPWRDSGHLFRGRFLDKCALVEQWAIETLAASGEASKARYLFGQKLAAVQKLAEANPSPLKGAQKILALLVQFQPLAVMRGDLAHSRLTVATTPEGAPLLIFEPCDAGPAAGRRSVVLREQDCRLVLDQLSSLANRLGQLRQISPS